MKFNLQLMNLFKYEHLILINVRCFVNLRKGLYCYGFNNSLLVLILKIM